MSIDPRMDAAQLERLADLHAAATPGPWSWNSYSAIAAQVPEGHPLEDYEEDDPGDRGTAWICWIDGGPQQKGHGDELRIAEARNNAALIESMRNALPALIAAAHRVSALEAEAARLREIIRQGRRHIAVILKQADAALAEMRAAVGNAGSPGDGPLRGVRGNLLALYDDLDRAALAARGGEGE